MRSYLFVIIFSAALTYILTPIFRVIAKKMHVITPLRNRDVHDTPVPRLGGVAMFFGLAITFVVASQMNFLENIFDYNAVWAVLGAAFLATVLGFFDDLWNLSWFVKFFGQFLIAAYLSWVGLSVLSLPIAGLAGLPGYIFLLITILAVISTMNAINFVDGLDGLASGMVAIGGVAFFIYSYLLTREANPTDYSSLSTLILASMVGVCLGFLPYNFFRAKIFMGDSGSMLLGLLLASSTIAVTGQVDPAQVSRAQFLPSFMPILIPVSVLLIPFYDLITSVVRRLYAGRSPFSADRGHLHHKLLDSGLSHTSAVLVLYMWAAVISFGTVAFVVTGVPVFLIILFDLFLLAVASVVTIFFNRKVSLFGRKG